MSVKLFQEKTNLTNTQTSSVTVLIEQNVPKADDPQDKIELCANIANAYLG